MNQRTKDYLAKLMTRPVPDGITHVHMNLRKGKPMNNVLKSYLDLPNGTTKYLEIEDGTAQLIFRGDGADTMIAPHPGYKPLSVLKVTLYTAHMESAAAFTGDSIVITEAGWLEYSPALKAGMFLLVTYRLEKVK